MNNPHRSRRWSRLLVPVVAASVLLAACGDDDDDSADTEAPADTEASADTEAPAETEAAGEEAPADTEAAEEEMAEEEAASGEPLRVAVVAPSASNDLAFTQSMVDSLDRVAEGRAIEVDITDGTFVVEDAAAAVRGYAEDGYDLVIAHGSQYGGPLQEIAPEFPEVSFAWGTSADTFGIENVYAYTPLSDQGGFVNGAIAAELTESSVIGVVGPIEVGDAKLYVDGFDAGVASVNPDIEVNINYIESFSDVALASEAATAHVGNGADVLTGTAQMVVGATGVANDEGIPWFGTQSNQTALGEDIVVASQVYHWEVALEQILDGVEAGTLGGESFILTFENGGLVMEYNDAYPLDDAVRDAADELVAGIADGSVSTGVE